MVTRTPPPTLPGLIAAQVLEPEVAALLWSAIDGGLPVVVVGEGPRPPRATVLAALAQVRPERDAWPDDLLGSLEPWPDRVGGEDAAAVTVVARPAEAGATRIDQPDATDQVRHYLVLAREGRTLGATIPAADLDAVFGRLEASPVGLHRDELGHLGIVVVLEPSSSAPEERPTALVATQVVVGTSPTAPASAAEAPRRVVAVHWVRPVARDAHDHVQRFPPAVLGARDATTGRWEDFSWAVMPELAGHLGRRAGELEAERDARAVFLSDLAEAGIVEPDAVARALLAYGAAFRSGRESP